MIFEDRWKGLITREGSRSVTFWSAVILITLGVVVLLGWSVGEPTITSLSPNLVSMKPITATTFILAGLGLLGIYRRWLTLASTALILILVMCLVTSVSAAIMPGRAAPFLLPHLDMVAIISPGMPSVGVLVGFAVAASGLIIWMVGNGPLRPVRRGCGVITVLLGASAIVGYISGIDILFWSIPGVSTAMAVHSALGFIVLGCAVHEADMARYCTEGKGR